jgi:hypothetical protein
MNAGRAGAYMGSVWVIAMLVSCAVVPCLVPGPHDWFKRSAVGAAYVRQHRPSRARTENRHGV